MPDDLSHIDPNNDAPIDPNTVCISVSDYKGLLKKAIRLETVDGVQSGDYITIPESEYIDLKEDSDFLACLEGGGVDNWEGYEGAQDHYQGSGD